MASLSPIYVCDILSFLPYTLLQQSRLVSRSLNNTIVSQPARLRARRCFSYLSAEVWDAERSTRCVGEDGYWTNSDAESQTKNWKRLQEEWGCCSELNVCWRFEADASRLAGECILPLYPAGCLVDIQIHYGTKRVFLRSRNEMTAVTAFGLLHLFDHLRDAAVGEMRQTDALNLSLFQLLSEEEHYQLHIYSTNVNTFRVNPTKEVEVYVANFDHLSTRLLWCWVENPVVGFDFALRARLYCKELELRYPREDLFDIALQHFQTILPAIGRQVVSVLDLCIMVRTHPIPWREGLLPKEEMESLGQGLYRQRGLTNINSGERFDVEVVYKAPWWRTVEEVDMVRLIFR